MNGVKRLVKRILPANIRNHVANAYHLLEAIIANWRYGHPARGAKVIMITGTNGKTTTAAFICSVLEAAGYKVGASTTAFYKIGDETTLNDQNMTVVNVFKLQRQLKQMKLAGCDYLVLEVTSHSLIQHRLWGVHCDVAVMTNLTQDHLDYHGTMENYAAAKGRMFARKPKLIVLNRDDEWFEFFNQYEAGERKVTYGTNRQATCQIAEADLGKNGTEVVLKLEGGQQLKFHTQLPGKFNVYNAAAAATVGYFLQIESAQIEKGLSAVNNVPGRMERVIEGQRFEVMIDYAHTPDALQNLLDTLRHLTKGKLWIVFGATGDRDKSKRPVMGEIAAKLADRVVLTDDEPYSEDPADIRKQVMEGIQQAGGQDRTAEIGDRKQAIAFALTEARPRDTVAITGMGHEQFRIVAGKREPWSDVQVAREVLQLKQRG